MEENYFRVSFGFFLRDSFKSSVFRLAAVLQVPLGFAGTGRSYFVAEVANPIALLKWKHFNPTNSSTYGKSSTLVSKGLPLYRQHPF